MHHKSAQKKYKVEIREEAFRSLLWLENLKENLGKPLGALLLWLENLWEQHLRRHPVAQMWSLPCFLSSRA